MIAVDAQRLLGRIRELGAVGRDGEGRLTRLAASDTDRQGRDLFVGWLRQAGLDVAIDRIGNIFGIWQSADNVGEAPLLIGSHIDTVIDAGIYDGCYGVLAGLEVIETLKASGLSPLRPLAVAAFTNEEGVRFSPDMMGSLVHAGGVDVEAALAAVGTDGSTLGQELVRIGYAGEREPGFLKPHLYVELHIEQGPVLEREGIPIGAVETCRASPGSASPSMASPTMPAPRRCRCAATPDMPRHAWSPSCMTLPRPPTRRPLPPSARCASSRTPSMSSHRAPS
ncbi:hypothetical protein MesoLj131b_49670 [Mesorhizobium sp. 131-2-5]|nr:hypothetical protein MesoLj131b_49670 [Mesorhizobium sp. 131-2-5]